MPRRLLLTTLLATATATFAGAEVPDWIWVHRVPRDEAIVRLGETLSQPRAEPSLFYLYGRLLQEAGRDRAATRAFAESIHRDPVLAPWARLRLAELVAASDHPETAAGLLVPLLDPAIPDTVRSTSAALLSRILSHGGDCDLLDRVATSDLAPVDHGRALLGEARCRAREGETENAREHLEAILLEGTDGALGAEVASELSALGAPGPPGPTLVPLVETLLEQGRLDEAARVLGRASAASASIDGRRLDYLTGRLDLARGNPAAAADAFRRLAETEGVGDPERARATYFEGLGLELAGHPGGARVAYARAAAHQPTGSWAGPSLFAILRLVSTAGDTEANRILELLASFPSHRAWAADGSLLLLAQDLAREQNGRLSTWAFVARRHGADPRSLAYWTGRADLARGRRTAAFDELGAIVVEEPWHPLARDARARLLDSRLAATREERIRSWLASGRPRERIAAWSLLPADDPRHDRVERAIYQSLTASPRWSAYLSIAPVPAERWPLWDRSLQDPQDRLLALGRWSEVPWAHVVERFPPTEPELSYTAVRGLAEAGAIGASVRLAALLVEPTRGSVPPSLLPLPLRHALYPLPEADTVEEVARRNEVDPALLAALLREEARAANETRSPGARAAQPPWSPPPIAPEIDDWALRAERLAARLRQLAAELGTHDPLALTLARAVGIPETKAWLAGAIEDRDPERLVRIGPAEPRRFVENVLTAAAAYRSIYPELGTERTDSATGP